MKRTDRQPDPRRRRLVAAPALMPALALAALLPACTAGPDYTRPVLAMPEGWKVEAPFRTGRPDDGALRGPWWQRFKDPTLDALQDKALAGSATLEIATARLAQTGALLESALAARYPQAAAALRDQRLRVSQNRPLTNYAQRQFSTVQDDYLAVLSVSYEIDFAGRVQRSIEGARATAAQSAADFENAKLLLAADLATAYFNLRAVDVELDVVRRAIGLQQRSLALAKSRHELGAASGLDMAQQQALLDGTLTQVDLLRRQRGQFEHAIATLTGTPAPLFSLPPQTHPLVPPVVPIGVPSDLLQRRPDVAAAERAMAVANAQVGLVEAAFYPSIVLGGTYGAQSRDLSQLFSLPSVVWSLGASVAQSIFDGGRLRALSASARSGYDITVGNYRRVVLTAMQEAEDGIIGLAALERAHGQALTAVASANRVLDIATARYEGGIATSLDVIVAQQSLLNAERLAAQILGQRMLASVFLVKALGGDWQGMAETRKP
ncbi:MAG: efflux transporter outer membrane subunit [bacterium]|jgi:NodT family efflux transporter outer membrane factor (OMF) lipoprotein|nr:efflux transporter outer membrane subunit [Betaproteobacteria bacterium]